MGHSIVASREALSEILKNPKTAGFFDNVVNFFTTKLEKKVEAEPIPEEDSEEVKEAERKFEKSVRDIVDSSLKNLIQVNFAPDKIRSLKHGEAIPKDVAESIKKKGLNIIHFTHQYYRYMLGHALEPKPIDFGLSKSEADLQIKLVKDKIGSDEPLEVDVHKLKKDKAVRSPMKGRYSMDRIAKTILAQDLEDDLEDDMDSSDEDMEELLEEEEDDDDVEEENPGDIDINWVESESDPSSPSTEYSCRIELIMDATFEGSVTRDDLVSKLKDELKKSITSGMQATSNDLGLASVGVKVFPIVMECSAVDETDEPE